MAITLNDLTVNFKHLDRDTLLKDWEWLIGPSKKPILLTAIGNAFVQDTVDGMVHLLDTGSGQIDVVANDETEFQQLLSEREFVMEALSVRMIAALLQGGRLLAPGDIYSFKVPPVLGGEYAMENIETTSIPVHFSLTGQICAQVQDLPPGTSIDSVSIESEDPDQAVLDQLVQMESDLTQPHQFNFYVYLPSDDLARQAAELAQHLGLHCRVEASESNSSWLCLASDTFVPTKDRIHTIQQGLTEIASQLRGDYDGWESDVKQSTL